MAGEGVIGSGVPVGTRKEILELHLDPMAWASCSPPTPRNRGCRHYGDCKVLRLLRSKGRPGFENVAFVAVKPNGAVKQDAERCHTFMDMRSKVDPRHARYQIIGLGGEAHIKVYETHEDPDDPKARRRTSRLVRKLVPRAPRPKDSLVDAMIHLEAASDAEQIAETELLANVPLTSRSLLSDEDRKMLETDRTEVPPGMDDGEDMAGDDSSDELAEDELGESLDDAEPEPVAAISKPKGRRRAAEKAEA